MKIPTIEEKIRQATKDVEEAMLENVLASKAETDAKIRRKKAHYRLQGATSRLDGIRSELMDFQPEIEELKG